MIYLSFDKSNYSKENMPSKGYLGTAKIDEGMYKGVGFHAWEQNNSEFIGQVRTIYIKTIISLLHLKIHQNFR